MLHDTREDNWRIVLGSVDLDDNMGEGISRFGVVMKVAIGENSRGIDDAVKAGATRTTQSRL